MGKGHKIRVNVDLNVKVDDEKEKKKSENQNDCLGETEKPDKISTNEEEIISNNGLTESENHNEYTDNLGVISTERSNVRRNPKITEVKGEL